jgi:hypothetical protein
MTALQAFVLGLLATPALSLIALGWMAWRAPVTARNDA